MLDRISLKERAKNIYLIKPVFFVVMQVVYTILSFRFLTYFISIPGLRLYMQQIIGIEDLKVYLFDQPIEFNNTFYLIFTLLTMVVMPLVTYVIQNMIKIKTLDVDLEVNQEQPAVIRSLNQLLPPLSIGVIIKVIGLNLIISIMSAIGFFLFFFPGLYVAYTYRYSNLVLAENPTDSFFEIMRKSALLTRRVKMSLFILDLSFFGWRFLVAIIGTITMQFPWVETSLAHILQPYVECTNILAYEAIKSYKTVSEVEY